jgi:putative transposase
MALITDNGPYFKSARFAALVAKRPELIHIGTRRKSPPHNGFPERAFGSLKYERFYRHEIDDGVELAVTRGLHRVCNTIRPREALAGAARSTCVSKSCQHA